MIWKHQCLVRWLIQYRIKDKAAAHLWLEAFKKTNPMSTLERDVKYQWSKGNRGKKGDWK
jgi:hypothetical protein